MADNQVKEQQQAEKPLSIDDLFSQLDVHLREENYKAWLNRIKEVLSSQLLRYRSNVSEIEKSLGECGFEKKFERIIGYIYRINDGTYYLDIRNKDNINKIINEVLLVESKPDLFLLEKNIIDSKRDIKFDSLIEEDKKRINNVFEEQDVHTAIYNYLVRELGDQKFADSTSIMEGYTTLLRNYLKSMEELNQAAEKLKDHLKLYPGRLGKRQARKLWEEILDSLLITLENQAAEKIRNHLKLYPGLLGKRQARKLWGGILDSLLNTLESKYSEVRHNYSQWKTMTVAQYKRAIPFPTEIRHISELNEILNELEARDPEPKIDVKKEGDGIYLILMEPTNQDYEIVKPSLILCGEYQPQLGTTTEVSIDLTKPPFQGDIFSNKVTQSDGKKLEVRLTINLKENLLPKTLRVYGKYELPYLRKEIEVEGLTLISEMMRLK